MHLREKVYSGKITDTYLCEDSIYGYGRGKMKTPSTEDEMQKRWRLLWVFFTILAVAQSAVLFMVSTKLPDRVPVHFSIAMKVDRWGKPGELCLISVITPFLFLLRPFIDRKFSQDPHNQKLEDVILLFIGSFIAVLSWWTVLLAFKPVPEQTRIAVTYLPCFVNFILGIFTVVFGNYEGTIRPNRTLGIKVKWTMEDEDNWRRTHQFAAPLAVLAGMVLIAGGVLVFVTMQVRWYLLSY